MRLAIWTCLFAACLVSCLVASLGSTAARNKEGDDDSKSLGVVKPKDGQRASKVDESKSKDDTKAKPKDDSKAEPKDEPKDKTKDDPKANAKDRTFISKLKDKAKDKDKGKSKGKDEAKSKDKDRNKPKSKSKDKKDKQTKSKNSKDKERDMPPKFREEMRVLLEKFDIQSMEAFVDEMHKWIKSRLLQTNYFPMLPECACMIRAGNKSMAWPLTTP